MHKKHVESEIKAWKECVDEFQQQKLELWILFYGNVIGIFGKFSRRIFLSNDVFSGFFSVMPWWHSLLFLVTSRVGGNRRRCNIRWGIWTTTCWTAVWRLLILKFRNPNIKEILKNLRKIKEILILKKGKYRSYPTRVLTGLQWRMGQQAHSSHRKITSRLFEN